jgi:hypothetical protein
MDTKISKGSLMHIPLLSSSSLSDKEVTSCISRGEELPLNSKEEFVISEGNNEN